jgi:hypothetical protein
VTGKPNLSAEAQRYADSLAALLTNTVCDYARVGMILRPDNVTAVVGTDPDSHTYRSKPVRLRTPRGAHCWLTVTSRFYLDTDGYLTAQRSAYIVSTGTAAEYDLFHYDYERGKRDYTEAHIQVHANSEPLKELLAAVGRPKDNLSKIHLPVGGRRFRPALEDVLEALIDERIVIGSPIWRDVLNESRDEFRRRQLKAAIRREPDVAAAALRALRYTVGEPKLASNVRSMLGQARRSKGKKR